MHDFTKVQPHRKSLRFQIEPMSSIYFILKPLQNISELKLQALSQKVESITVKKLTSIITILQRKSLMDGNDNLKN